MKFIVLAVVSTALFRADCRERPIDQEISNDERVHIEGMLRGGSKTCKPDIVCSLLDGSCTATSAYCNGREVASLCGGEKCKCCIPVTLEVKMHEMETALNSLVVNFTAEDAKLHKDMYTLANSIISNITISNEDVINVVNSSNQHLSNSNSDMKNELQNIVSKIDTMGNLENVTNAIANLASKLDTMIFTQACQVDDGGFLIGTQCFKRFALEKTWDEALKYCVDKGLNLAQPSNPTLLHKYMHVNDMFTWAGRRHWIGGQGTGSCVAFLNGTCIPNGNVWETLGYANYGRPDSTATNAGLDMDGRYEDHPFDVDGKTSKKYFVCEMEK